MRWATLALGVVALGACTREASDSRGLSAQPDTTPRVRVTDELGEILQFVRSGALLGDGRIVVADEYAGAIHFFKPDGTFEHSVGRKGKGPGEFTDLRWVAQCASDTLFVWDYGSRVITVLDDSGSAVRSYRPEGTLQELACARNAMIGAIGMTGRPVPPSGSGERSPAPLWIADVEGRVRSSIGEVPLGENRPLGKLTRIAMSADRMFVGTGDSAWVDMYALDGQPLGGILIGIEGRPPTEEAVAASLEKMISVAPVGALRDRFREWYRDIPMPSAMPPYFELRTDPRGDLWAVVSPPGGERTVLQHFSIERGQTSELVLPGSVTVFEVGENYALGVAEERNGVQSIVVYDFDPKRLTLLENAHRQDQEF